MNYLQVFERNNQRVLTTEQLAEVYETESIRIQQNFNRNSEKFIEGRHFFRLIGEELKQFKANYLKDSNLKYAPELILWTERGASRHCKILDTDKAWEQFDYLEDTYFTSNQNEIDIKQLSPEMQMFKQIFDSVAAAQIKQKELDEKIEATNNRIDSIKEVVSLDSTSWRADTQNLLNKIALKLGGTSQFFQQLRKESYDLLERKYGVNLKIRLTNKRRRMAEDGVSKSKRDNVTKIDIIAEDKKLIEGYVSIIKDMSIKYGIVD